MRELKSTGYFTTIPSGEQIVNVFAKKAKTTIAAGLTYETEQPEGAKALNLKTGGQTINLAEMAFNGLAASCI